ncbi:hypothetical protein HGA34_03235 [Candidatus Falkowbacteria bacterium]|nr:hypothetical protein [Candidatus Falkowbacteria bacterium]
MATRNLRPVEFKFGLITWRSYNSIKKKAMEQEFSMSGLALSLSIAFFIVLGSAQALSVTYQGIMAAEQLQNQETKQNQLNQEEFKKLSFAYLC